MSGGCAGKGEPPQQCAGGGEEGGGSGERAEEAPAPAYYANASEELNAARLLRTHVLPRVADCDDAMAVAEGCIMLRGPAIVRAATVIYEGLSWQRSSFSVRAPPRQRNEDNDVLVRAAGFGLTGICGWIGTHERAAWASPADARLSAVAAFRAACSGGHLEIAQWIARRWRLDSRDVRDRGNLALSMACWSAQLHVAEWLADEFELGPADGAAVFSDNPVVREWLARRFGASAAVSSDSAPKRLS